MPLENEFKHNSASVAFARLNAFERLQLRILLGFAAALRLVGYKGLRHIGIAAGWIIWNFLPKRRELAVKAIMVHLNKERKAAEHIARASFNNNICSFFELIFTPQFRLKNNPLLLPFSQNAKRVCAEQKAVVAVLGHIGAWELLAGILEEFRAEYPRIVVVRNQRSKVLNAFIHRLRSQGGAASVGHRNAAPVVSATLRQNGTAAFLVDHNCSRQEAIFLPFLGEIAAVNSGPALLALRSKAMVYPLFLLRTNDGKYDFIVREPLDTSTLKGSIHERTEQIAKYYNSAAEEIVREHPEQWFWMHKRWKTRPAGEESEQED